MDKVATIKRYLKDQIVITTKEAKVLGVNAMMLSRAADDGWLYRISRGVYTDKPDILFDSLKKYLPVTVRYNNAVVALVSALTFHQLTDEEERKISFALPHAEKFQNPKNVQIVRLSGNAYSLGIETHTIGRRKINIYDPEKSVVDAFKYLSQDVAIKSLKNYLVQPKIDVKKLLEYAEKLKRPLHAEIKTIMTV